MKTHQNSKFKSKKCLIFILYFSLFKNALAQPPAINFVAPTGQRTVLQILETVLTYIIAIGFPAVTIAIIYSGIKFLFARGDEFAIRSAKRMLFWSIIGGVIVFSSFIIINSIAEIIRRRTLFP